jgi:hypothetical protein
MKGRRHRNEELIPAFLNRKIRYAGIKILFIPGGGSRRNQLINPEVDLGAGLINDYFVAVTFTTHQINS